MHHAATFVRVKQPRQLAHVGPKAHKDKIFHRHGKALRPPKVLCRTTKQGNAAPGAVITHFDIVLHPPHIFSINVFCFVQQATQRQFIFIDTPAMGIDVQIDAEHRAIMTFEFYRLANVIFI